MKGQVNAGRRRELYYFRDQQGLEVDFILPGRAGALTLLECKATRTVTPGMAAPMRRLAEAMTERDRRRVVMLVAHEASKAGSPTRALAPGVRALPWTGVLEEG